MLSWGEVALAATAFFLLVDVLEARARLRRADMLIASLRFKLMSARLDLEHHRVDPYYQPVQLVVTPPVFDQDQNEGAANV